MSELFEFVMEPLEKKRKQLIFRSWHRGTREMDLLMGSFAEKYVAGFSEAELAQYYDILEISDPDLYNWISGQEPAPAEMVHGVFKKLMAHRFKG